MGNSSGNANSLAKGKHEHILNYELKQLNQDMLNDELFGFITSGILTTWHERVHTCLYHVCQLLYHAIVQQLTDMVQTCI